nr:hypothetical protein [Tanacetum cinerariifolium]
MPPKPDLVSYSEEESETKVTQFVPSFAQSSEYVKSLRHSDQPIETSIPAATSVPASLTSSPGIAAAEDPESENASSPAEELEIKNLEALLETEADMKRVVEDKSAGLIKELEDMHARFLDLQVSNEHLSQQVVTLQEQVSGEEKLKAAF